MNKKTMGVLLTILLLSVYCVSVYADGGIPFNDIWDYILTVINPTLEDHEARITALEGHGEQIIKIGMTSASSDSFVQTECVAAIAEADINQYVEGLGLDMTFEFVVKDNQGSSETALYNTMLFKVTGIDLVIGHPWSGQCADSLDYVNTNNMLLISGSSTDPWLATPNDRLFRTCPNDAVIIPLAEMWKTWGAEAVLTMCEVDTWGSFYWNDFVSELNDRGLVDLGLIQYECDEGDYSSYLDEANETIIESMKTNDVERIGLQFFARNELGTIQFQASDYPNLMNVTWMTVESWRYEEILDEEGEWATQTRHFKPIITVDETSILYQKFVEKYEQFGYTVEPLTAMQYDACWLLAETIIETGSTDAGVIAANLIQISDSITGITGCLALDDNGDRLPQLYNIMGFYEDESGEYLEGTFGSYDGNTGTVDWNDDFLELTGITRPGKP